MTNKKELNLESEQHSKLITNIIEKSLTGITVKEIIELKNTCEQDSYEYYNKLKLRYIVPFGLLGLNYNLTLEIEETIFFFIHDIIHQISVNGNPATELDVTLS